MYVYNSLGSQAFPEYSRTSGFSLSVASMQLESLGSKAMYMHVSSSKLTHNSSYVSYLLQDETRPLALCAVRAAQAYGVWFFRTNA